MQVCRVHLFQYVGVSDSSKQGLTPVFFSDPDIDSIGGFEFAQNRASRRGSDFKFLSFGLFFVVKCESLSLQSCLHSHHQY